MMTPAQQAILRRLGQPGARLQVAYTGEGPVFTVIGGGDPLALTATDFAALQGGQRLQPTGPADPFETYYVLSDAGRRAYEELPPCP